MKIYVIPGTHNEATNWIMHDCNRRGKSGNPVSLSDYVTVLDGDIHRLRGLRNPRGVFVGTWREREDLHEICVQLNLSHNCQNVVIHRIMIEELGYESK
jgi:hypothetical protein